MTPLNQKSVDIINSGSAPQAVYLNVDLGITVFKIFIWGGISSDIRLEI